MLERVLVLACLLCGCELPDKQVGLDPEPPDPMAEVCRASCEHRTACLDTDAFDCLQACEDDLAGADANACLEAKLDLYACREALSCEALSDSLEDPGAGPCSEEASMEAASCDG